MKPPPRQDGVADMSGANMRQIVAVIEQNMEICLLYTSDAADE